MENFLFHLVLGLAVWRVASLLVREDGPFEMLSAFRYKIGIRFNIESRPYGENVIAKAFTCVWCVSVWLGLVAAFLSPYSTNILTYGMSALSLSTIAILVDCQAEKI